jgi:hypothetical protein
MFVKEACSLLDVFIEASPFLLRNHNECDSRHTPTSHNCLLTRQCRIKAKVFSINEESRISTSGTLVSAMIVTVGVYE